MKRISLKQKIALVVFGLFVCVVLLEIGLRIGGFVLLYLQEHGNKISLKQKKTYRIMCLGESTTAGYQNSYPSRLQEILDQKDIGVNFSVINKGISGTNTGYIVSQLEDNLNKYNPQMVITMIGINDGRNARPYEDMPNKKSLLSFKSFRTYKLKKLLHFRIINKAIEIGVYRKEDILKKAVEINPENERGYINLGWYYNDTGEHNKAEEMFKKAIAINPENVQRYIELGWYYKRIGEHNKAEETFKKAIEMNPENQWGYCGLGWHYSDTGEYNKAEETFKKAIEINPENTRLNAALAISYEEGGKYNLAEEYYKKTERLRTEYYNPVTGHNYNRLKEIVTKRGIRLICVQYPVRSVESLKNMFKDKKDVIFVDNERLFKEAVGREGYTEYFVDMLAGDFGHATKKGNRLLAENIANTILKECF